MFRGIWCVPRVRSKQRLLMESGLSTQSIAFAFSKPNDLTKNNSSRSTATTSNNDATPPLPYRSSNRNLLSRNILQLLRGLVTSASLKFKIPVRHVGTIDRLVAAILCSTTFEDSSKPHFTTLAYIDKDDMNTNDCIPTFEDPTSFPIRENKTVVLCVVLPGTNGESMTDPNVDTSRSSTVHGAHTIRSSKQVLPLVEIRGIDMKDKQQDVSAMHEHLLNTVDGFFGALRPRNVYGNDTDDREIDSSQQHETVQLSDVGCDRTDKRCSTHHGNQRFAVIVCIILFKMMQNLHCVNTRRNVAAAIVSIITDGKAGGRFLGKTVRGTWKQLGHGLSIRWVGAILKQAVENERNRTNVVANNDTERTPGESMSAGPLEMDKSHTSDDDDKDDNVDDGMNEEGEEKKEEDESNDVPLVDEIQQEGTMCAWENRFNRMAS